MKPLFPYEDSNVASNARLSGHVLFSDLQALHISNNGVTDLVSNTGVYYPPGFKEYGLKMDLTTLSSLDIL